MEEVHFSRIDARDLPFKKVYLKVTSLLIACFVLGFGIFDAFILLNFRAERLKDLHGDVKELAWHLDFSLFALAQTVNRLDRLFDNPPAYPPPDLKALLKPLPLLGSERWYGQVTIPSQGQSGLVDVAHPVPSLKKEDAFMLACFLTGSQEKIAALYRLFPAIDSLIYVSPQVRFFFPWTHFPPRIDPAWVHRTQNLQFSVLEAAAVEGWRPLSYHASFDDWTIHYVRPHLVKNTLKGFFALTLKPVFFEKTLERLHIPFGCCLLIDGEGKKILHKDAKGFNFESAFLNEVLPLGLRAKDMLGLPAGEMSYQPVTWFRGYWTFGVSLAKTPFKVVYFCDSLELLAREVGHILYLIVWQSMIVLVLVVFHYVMVQRFFTDPLLRLMAHINQERLGLRTHGALFSSAWKSWAQFISAAFGEKKKRAVALEFRLQERVWELRRVSEHLEQAEKHLMMQDQLIGSGTLALGLAVQLQQPLQSLVLRAQKMKDALRHLGENATCPPDLLAQVQRAIQEIQDETLQTQGVIKHIVAPGWRGSYEDGLEMRELIRTYLSFCYHGYMVQMEAIPLVLELCQDAAAPLITVLPRQETGQVLAGLWGTLFEGLRQCFVAQQAKGNVFIPALHVHLSREGHMCVLSLKGHPLGVFQPLGENRFDPFSRSDDFFQRHGGTLHVTTSDEEGTCVVIKVPLKQGT